MANLQKKTIIGKQIKSFQFSWMKVARFNREMIFGHIWLEGGERVRIEYGKYLIVNPAGETSGIILKSNPAYRLIKRLISRWFSSYRKGNKGGVAHHAEYWRSRAIDGLHNVNLFRHSEISFKENPSNFLRLAS